MIYFDNAATGFPKPECVYRALNDCLRLCGGNPGRGGHALSLAATEIVYDCRAAVAELIGGAQPEQIVFVPNATYALNLAILTRVRRGSHILMSDREHNAVRRLVEALARDPENEISYSIFRTDGSIMQAIEASISSRSDLLVCNLTSNLTGRTLPVEALISAARRYRLYLILDLSQWIGHFPVPRCLSEADALCAPGHKGLYGIQGGGFLYLKGCSGLRPFLYGGSGVDSRESDMPKELPERYEAGTLPTPAIAALRAGIGFVTELGLREIEVREAKLTARCREILSSFRGVRIFGAQERCGSLLSFTHEQMTSEYIADQLNQSGICVRGGFHCAPLAHDSEIGDPNGAVRISFGVFNTAEELEGLYRVLKDLLK